MKNDEANKIPSENFPKAVPQLNFELSTSPSKGEPNKMPQLSICTNQTNGKSLSESQEFRIGIFVRNSLKASESNGLLENQEKPANLNLSGLPDRLKDLNEASSISINGSFLSENTDGKESKRKTRRLTNLFSRFSKFNKGDNGEKKDEKDKRGSVEMKGALPEATNCLLELAEKDDDLQLEEEMLQLSREPVKYLLQMVYLFLETTTIWTSSKVYHVLMSVMPLIQTVLIILETTGVLDKVWIYFTMGFSLFYVLELVAKLLCHSAFEESFLEFFMKYANFIEILSVIDIALEVEFFWKGENSEPPHIFRVFRIFSLLRLVRVFKFRIFSNHVIVLFDAIKESIQVLVILTVLTSVSMLIMANLQNSTENQLFGSEIDSPRKVSDVPTAFWWVLITISTVGYGDYVPLTNFGRFFGALTLLFGVLLISLPVAIIGNKFTESYANQKKNLEMKQRSEMKDILADVTEEDEKRLLEIIVELNQLAEMNEAVESELENVQFLMRSLRRDTKHLMSFIELESKEEKMKKTKSRAYRDKMKKKRIKKMQKKIESRKSEANLPS